MSSIGFKYWFYAFLQRNARRELTASSLAFAQCAQMRPPETFASIADDDELAEIFERRRAFIRGEDVDIAEDCLRLAAIASYCEMPLDLRPSYRGDTFLRMAMDANSLIAGTYEWIWRPDWDIANLVGFEQPLRYGAAFGHSDAAVDVVTETCLTEIKPVRSVAGERSSDQMAAYYLLHQMQHPDQPIRELRFFMPRHATVAVASAAEIEARFPLREYGDWLFASEAARVERLLGESLEAYKDRQAEAAAGRAWEMMEQQVMIGRRIERAGRIGIATLSEVREVAPVLSVDLSRTVDEDLAPRLRRLLEAIRLDEIWEREHAEQRRRAQEQKVHLEEGAEHWREFAGRRWPQAQAGV